MNGDTYRNVNLHLVKIMIQSNNVIVYTHFTVIWFHIDFVISAFIGITLPKWTMHSAMHCTL